MPVPAQAQLDPLIALKRVPPNVVVVIDTSFRMLDDGTGTYYDPTTYVRSYDPTVAAAMGVPSSATYYRRQYVDLDFENVVDSNSKYTTTDIVAVADTSLAFKSFWSSTRFEVAKAGVVRAVEENARLVRWGLVKLRQNSEEWREPSDCDKPVRVTGNVLLSGMSDTNPCNVGGASGRFGIGAPKVSGANFSIESPPGDAVVQDARRWNGHVLRPDDLCEVLRPHRRRRHGRAVERHVLPPQVRRPRF